MSSARSLVGASMRKIILSIASALLLMASAITANAQCEECGPPPGGSSGSSSAGAWAVGCGGLSFASLLVGTMINAAATPARQLTVTEASWFAAACPVMLPIALLTTTTCPDNNATREVARLAYRYIRRVPTGDQSAFTNAYVEACRDGRLSAATRSALLRLSH